jgi:hypothetical protein
VYLNQAEDQLIEAIADYTGKEKSVLMRELVLDRLAVLMGAEFERPAAGDEVPMRVRSYG